MWIMDFDIWIIDLGSLQFDISPSNKLFNIVNTYIMNLYLMSYQGAREKPTGQSFIGILIQNLET